MTLPGFYLGRLWHRRAEPKHAFDRDLLLALADVDAIDAAPRGELALAGRWPISLRREDHLPPSGNATAVSPRPSLRESVVATVSRQTGRTPTGPMFLLSQPRCFGLTFNPVSFVYCLSEGEGDGESEVEAVVAEVTNTPWGERHAYVLSDPVSRASGDLRYTLPKRMHVSPFFEMNHDYVFSLRSPDERIRLSITILRDRERVFGAGFDLRRTAGFEDSPPLAVLRHAFVPYETLVGIYSQAARLAWKRVPFHPHPSRLAAPSRADGPPLESGDDS